MKYIFRKYQVIYSSGCRDKVNLGVPIETDNLEKLRAELKIKHTHHGMKCVGVNLDYDEIKV